MKKIIAIAALLIPSFAVGEMTCEKSLSSYGDSRVFRLKTDGDLLDERETRGLILKALRHKCKQGEIRFDMIGCSAIIPSNESSISCYAETNVGFFFVHTDMLNTATVTWNRWD